MITLESKLAVAEKALNNVDAIEMTMKPFADMLGKSVEEIKEELLTNETTMAMFHKFMVAVVVSATNAKAA